MAQYSANSWYFYDAATGNYIGEQDLSNFIANDLEADSTFELGDSVNGGTFDYVGQMLFDGSVLPVFYDAGLDRYYVLSPKSTAEVNAPASVPTTPADTSPFPVCYGKGTGIETPRGERAVEHLRIGDLVRTPEGHVPVKWIGRQTLVPQFAGERTAPVRIRAGTLGGGLPHSDLTVTADHGMVIDGLVINAAALVNGESIAFMPLSELPATVTYYHVETEDHDVILANGAPAETFIDYVGRRAFDNHREYLDLYGAERIIREMAAPRISSARLVPGAIRARLGIAGMANVQDALRTA